MRYCLGLFLGVFGLFFLAACGGGGSSSTPVQPSTSQLVGSWVHTNPADMLGLEFTKDGKAMLYYGNGSDAMAADYKLQDDGRLSLNLGGQMNFYQPTLANDKLQLKETATGNVMEYRRLNSGETIVAAIATQDQAAKKAIADRNSAVPNFVARTDLVMVISGNDPHAPAPCALEFAPGPNGYSGRALFNSKPPHVENLTAQIRSGDSPIFDIFFGVTANNPNGTSQISFRPVGTAPDITLSAQVNFGETFNTNANNTAVIKPDTALRQQILDTFKAEAERLTALKAPVIALLKDYVVLKGTSQSMLPNQREGFADQITLSRNPQNNTWIGQGQSVNRATGATEIFPVMAAVGVVSDKPVVQIMSQKRLYQFADIDTAAGKLTGAWQMPNNPNGRAAELTITQAVDAKERDQIFATAKAALQKLDPSTIYHAVISDQYNNGATPPNPIAVTLAADAGGTISGKVDYPLMGCTITLAGKQVDTPLGPQLQLRYAGGQANAGAWADAPAFINSVQHEAWLLSPATDANGNMRLTGYATTNPSNPGVAPITLQLIPYTDKDKAALVQALAAGVNFKLINPPIANGQNDILAFTTDPATNKITGTLTTAGYQINSSKGITFTGEIKDQAGWAEMVMPVIRFAGRQPDYSYTVLISPTDEGLYLNAAVYSIRIGPTKPLGRWDALQVKP